MFIQFIDNFIVVVMAFNIQQLKERYRQILQRNSDESDEQKSQRCAAEIPYKTDKKSRMLTEHCQNISASKITSKQQNSAIVIALKQRVAQGLRNLSEKDSQINNLKKQIIEQQQKMILIQKQLAQLKGNAHEGEKKLIQEKVNAGSLQKDIKGLQNIIEALHVERELTVKQNQFYKSQISSLKTQKGQCLKKLQIIDKELKKVQKVKLQNSRLKEDMKRLQIIINECYQGKDTVDVANKHYLGKPYKQKNCWFSDNLIGQVQFFLRKQQVAQGNNGFVNHLVKFISQLVQSTKKSDRKQVRQSVDRSSHHKSSSVHEMVDSSIKTTQNIGLTQSTLKKSLLISKFKKIDYKKYNDYFMVPDKEKLEPSVFKEIIGEYQKILGEVLNEKEVEPKKVIRLSEEMASNVQQAVSRIYY